MRLHQISEDDLVVLEQTLPLLQDCLMLEPEATPRIRVLLGKCKQVLSDVRWNYGPPTNVERVEDE